ncbi:MAG TPA: hypothetical protein VFX59_13235 [Polyangiales bacterium]|nr:hypothetical protein [Polyangiales bacterium]
MSRIEPFIQLRYWGLRPSAQLEDTIADASARLRPLRDRIERCELHVGRWSLHHDQGQLFRATLSVELAGGGAPIALEEETEVGAPVAARAEVLDTVFQRAASRIKA